MTRRPNVVGVLAWVLAYGAVGALSLVGWWLVTGEWRFGLVLFCVVPGAIANLLFIRLAGKSGPGGLTRADVDTALRRERLPDDADGAAWATALAARRTEVAPLVSGAVVGLGSCAAIAGLLTADQGWGPAGWAVTAAFLVAAVPARALARSRLARIDRLAAPLPQR